MKLPGKQSGKSAGGSPINASDSHLLALLNAGPLAALLMTPQGVILALNEKMARNVFRKSAEKCVDQNFFDLSSSALRDLRWVKAQEAISRKKTVRLEQYDNNRIFITTFEPLLNEKRVTHLAVFIEDATQEGQAKKEQLEIQRDIGLSLSAAEDLKSTVRHILEALIGHHEIDAGMAFLAHGSEFERLEYIGLQPAFANQYIRVPADYPTVQRLMLGETVYELFAKLPGASRPGGKEEKLLASTILPIRFQDQIIAALFLSSRSQKEFSFETRRLMESIASQLGPVIARAQASEALKESQQNLSNLFQTMDDFLLVLDTKGRLVDVNTAVVKRLGYGPQELQGQHVSRLFPAGRQSWSETLLRPSADNQPIQSIHLQAKDNSLIPVEMKVAAGSWGGQKVFFAIGRNISQRLKAETALVLRERILEAVGFASEQFLEEVDWESSVKTVLEQLGISLDIGRVYLVENRIDTEGELWMKPRMEWTAEDVEPAMYPGGRLMPQSYKEAGLDRWRNVLSHGNILADVVSKLPPEEQLSLSPQTVLSIALVPVFVGPVFWGFLGYEDMHRPSTWSSSELDALYTASNILGAAIQREQAEQAMRQNLQFQETFVDTIPSPAFYKDANGVYQGCNAAFSQLILGMPKRDIIGRRATDFNNLPEDLVDLLFDKDMALVRGPGAQIYEATVPCADSTTRDFIFNKTTFLDETGKVLGICGVMTDITDRKMAEYELTQARQQEINIGFEIQNRLLLGTPPQDLSQVEIATLSIPSQQIDGDFYDFIKYDDQHFDLIIGDVMGKGISAALLGAAIKTQFLRAIGNLVCSTNLATLPTPEEVLSFVHRMMSQKLMSLNSFATGCYARFSIDKGRMDLVDFGHTRTLHYSTDKQKCLQLKSENFPLGFSDDEEYVQISEHLSPGDIILFYSDGLIEAKSPQGEQFGLERLVEFVEDRHSLSAEAMSKELYSELIHFSSSVSFADDLTYLILKIQEREDVPMIAQEKLEITSQLTELSRLRDFLQLACRKLPNATVRFTAQLELAASEAASNIMRHAYKSRGDRPIEVIAEIYRDRVAVKLIHWGEPMQSFQLGTPAFDGSQKHGLGLYFIRNCVDEVKYHTDNQGVSSVRLMKKLKPE